MHDAPHPQAGQAVTVKPAAALFGDEGTEPVEMHLEDWADLIFGAPWGGMTGNPAALAYAVRCAAGQLPLDNEVVYAKGPGGSGHLIHVDELEGGAQ